MFMVAGIYFLREMLVFTFTKLLVKVRSKTLLSFLFVSMGALLSAFLDALTVLAVMITVIAGFYGVYHRVASGKREHHDDAHDSSHDEFVLDERRIELEDFRAFVRNLIMHVSTCSQRCLLATRTRDWCMCCGFRNGIWVSYACAVPSFRKLCHYCVSERMVSEHALKHKWRVSHNDIPALRKLAFLFHSTKKEYRGIRTLIPRALVLAYFGCRTWPQFLALTAKRAAVLRCLIEGNSILSTSRITGVAKNSIVKLLAQAGDACR